MLRRRTALRSVVRIGARRRDIMKCPNCDGTTLLMSERQGVEIDYCPKCRGVWLDRGELDKLIERASADAAPPSVATHARDFEDSDFRRKGQHGQHRPKKSWLSDIFD
jgi:Zn-finger nucleic acid-binding protein